MTTLERVKAGIENQLFIGRILNSKDFDDGLKWCLELIDKYAEQEPKWIPMTTRPMTEEEREHYREWSDFDEAMIFDCELPEDGQEVLVSYGGYVCLDVFCKDDGCYFEGVDIDDVDAWMPLPEPYEPQESEVRNEHTQR